METGVILGFLGACLIFSFSPGPGVLNTISYSITTNYKCVLWSILGLEIGLIILLFMTSIGLGALIAYSPVLYNVVKWCGVGYLLYLGISKITEQPAETHFESEKIKSSSKVLLSSILLNLSNPKSLVFLLALFPQFISSSNDRLFQFFILGFILVVIDTLFHITYSIFALQFKNLLMKTYLMKMFQRAIGSLLIGAGITLAISRS